MAINKYKPFHNRLAKEEFPEWMMALCQRLLEKLSDEELHFMDERPFSRFSPILLHEGGSFALKPALHFPGRFNKLSPAGVEFHVTMDLFTGFFVELCKILGKIDCFPIQLK